MAARTRTHVVVIGATLAGLVLAGCANAAVLDRASPEDSLARVQGAAAKVTEAGSARLSMTVRTIFAGEEVAASTATTVGAYDFAAHKGQMDTTIKPAGMPFRVTEHTLVIGSTVYIKMENPPEASALPDGVPAVPEDHHKPWAKLELPKELAGQGGLGLGLEPDVGADPTQTLAYLKAAASKVELIGSEQLRGTLTTRYAVTLDAAKVAAQAPEELQGFADASGLAFPKPADVWIDQQGRLRKIHYTMTMNAPGEATPTPITLETTLELYDFGVAVHVTPPPPNQVEVVRPDLPPPGCTPEKGNGKAGSSGATSPDAAQGEPVCPQGSTSGGVSGTTTP